MVAQAGAAAALTGLLFVSLSINLEGLLKEPALLNRAGASLAMLLGVLLTSSLTLVPDLGSGRLGVLVLLVGGILWAMVTLLSVKNVEGIDVEYRRRAIGFLGFRQLAIVPLLVGGIVLATGNDRGMFWIAGAFTVTFVVTIVEAWVLLVEIDR
jgi:modulator of FtsH protease